MILKNHLQKRRAPLPADHPLLLAIDLDGTIADHHLHYDLDRTQPREGAREAMERLWDEGFQLVIWTARDDLDEVADWLDEWRIPYDFINEAPNQPTDSRKLVADLYLDDRGLDGRQDWNRLLRQVHDRLGKPDRNQRTRHLIITGASGAGKTFTSQLLSEVTGMSVWKVDQDKLWMSSDDIVDHPERYEKGTRAYRKYRKLLKKLVRRALKRKQPSILEGCQFLVAPGTLRGHRIVIIDADEGTVVRQRLQRDEAEGKLTFNNRGEREQKARDLYEKLLPFIEAMKELPGVETVTPAKAIEWINGFERERSRQKSLLKNDFAGIGRFGQPGPPQGILTPTVNGPLDTSGEGLGDKLRRIVPSGYYGQDRADNWHLPQNKLASVSASTQGGERVEEVDATLVNRLPSQQRRRVLSRLDDVGGLEGFRVDTVRPVSRLENALHKCPYCGGQT